ncbi:MAG TPA: glycoside hydrolase family 172 protein, partial [Bryobacteraceae bacterium]|nr:glycoside hydrolase family 172 protein [Bryobacteraceae bacterium]
AAPSVEVPLGDFFANAHGMRYNVNSLMVAVNPSGGFNAYWPMPFRKRARVTVENQNPKAIEGFFYQITYALEPVPEDAAYFHATWRRSMTTREHPEHVLVDGIEGRGHYVGTFIGWEQLSNGWWGEGEMKFYLDGDDKYPTICGTGTEDYFGGAWGFGSTFSAPFSGYPLSLNKPGEIPKHALYRWHVPDPIRFQKSLRVTIQALGWWPDGKFQPLTDDIASVAYWYQSEPHRPFPAMLSREARFPR